MLDRSGEYDEAAGKIAEIFQSKEFSDVENGLAMLCFSLQMGQFNRDKRYADAEKAFISCIIHPSFDNDYSSNFSSVLYKYAFALLKTHRSKEAEEVALKAIQHSRNNNDALWILREIRSQNDFSKAKYMRVLVCGKWVEQGDDSKEEYGFYSSYDVVADSEEEALSYIREVEPKEIRDSLKIDEVEIRRSPKQPKGIYQISEYFFYENED